MSRFLQPPGSTNPKLSTSFSPCKLHEVESWQAEAYFPPPHSIGHQSVKTAASTEHFLSECGIVSLGFNLDDPSNLTNLSSMLHIAMDKFNMFAMTCSEPSLDALITLVQRENDKWQDHFNFAEQYSWTFQPVAAPGSVYRHRMDAQMDIDSEGSGKDHGSSSQPSEFGEMEQGDATAESTARLLGMQRILNTQKSANFYRDLLFSRETELTPEEEQICREILALEELVKSNPNIFEDATTTTIPMGYSYFPKEFIVLPRRWLRAPNLVFESKHKSGCHFTAYEKPEELVGDLRRMFGKGRPAFAVIPGKMGYD
ncbi:unnamed protein product [Cyclocybe aegerita]|uniref:Uncharacterized protein n=1 Tax=Cyclocybe aegerita TaxID=1973307 RepID=A0A8S0W1G7_CYCAE|nr:unnamed protein product [Cyclocybe aegerita]